MNVREKQREAFRRRALEITEDEDREHRDDAEALKAREEIERRRSDGESQNPPEPGERTSLLADDMEEDLRSHWTTIQTAFVDEPRQAVRDADDLVQDVIGQLTTLFTGERAKLEQQWGRHDDVSTEDLRLAMQRYRAFFDRLLSI